MKILAIETSCDETAISLVDAKGDHSNATFEILGNVVLSQAKLHAEYGGVFPNLAKREHAKNLIPVFEQVLKESNFLKSKGKESGNELKALSSKLKAVFEREPELLKQFLEFIPKIEKPDIDLIAVTSGPGLEPALWVGINFAHALSLVWGIPVIPANHMEGHIVSSLLETSSKVKSQKLKVIEFPVLALLISGGHTEIVLMRDWMDYEIIGHTRDDAVGEAFDKVARLLGLPYPGGPEISRIAQLGTPTTKWKLPRPMVNSGDYDFSFSGIKTAVLYKTKEAGELSTKDKQDLALEFETAVTEVLLKKTLGAAREYGAKTVILGGGVSANKRIRETFEKEISEKHPRIDFIVPNLDLSTDNALMIAVAAYFRANRDDSTISKAGAVEIRADGNMPLA